jgi:hypothetical protein
MPWTVFVELERLRKRARSRDSRAQGTCGDTIEAVIAQTSALLRRRGSEDVATVSALITGAPYCVPCISIVTNLDARRIYVALERLRAEVNVRLVSDICTRCRRTTTVHVIAE